SGAPSGGFIISFILPSIPFGTPNAPVLGGGMLKYTFMLPAGILSTKYLPFVPIGPPYSLPSAALKIMVPPGKALPLYVTVPETSDLSPKEQPDARNNMGTVRTKPTRNQKKVRLDMNYPHIGRVNWKKGVSARYRKRLGVLRFAAFKDESWAYQSDPSTSPQLQVTACQNVTVLTPCEISRTLPSPMAAKMPAVCPVLARLPLPQLGTTFGQLGLV